MGAFLLPGDATGVAGSGCLHKQVASGTTLVGAIQEGRFLEIAWGFGIVCAAPVPERIEVYAVYVSHD
ncbi:hypothetical protein CPI83_29360 (plasmid) [Rhodococcus sp. H-CA8f]|nr:hypothetical protein CPI83_29360 [Rhodococcus sp. H-CA8f]